jgi:hypothetical protein
MLHGETRNDVLTATGRAVAHGGLRNAAKVFRDLARSCAGKQGPNDGDHHIQNNQYAHHNGNVVQAVGALLLQVESIKARMYGIGW